MLKLQDFRDVGYSVTKCAITARMEADTYKWLIQKPVYGESDKKYFINVFVCDIRLWDIYDKDRMNYMPSRTLTIKQCYQKDDLTFWIDICKNKEFQSIEEIELICEEFFQNMCCNYYD
jgi:hypothetical protein